MREQVFSGTDDAAHRNGLHGSGFDQRWFGPLQRPLYALSLLALVLLAAQRGQQPEKLSPDALYQSIEDQFTHGELDRAEAAARHAAMSRLQPLWAARFRLQHAKIELYQGHSPDALLLLQAQPPAGHPELAATRGTLLAIAYSRTGDLAHAQQALAEAEGQCHDALSRSGVYLARGVVDGENGKLGTAEHDFILSLDGARAGGDRFLETQALLNLGVVALRQEHYDDALNRFRQASTVAQAIDARLALEKATGAVASTYYKIGDYRRALASSQLAEKQAATFGSLIDEVAWLNDEGLSQYKLGDLVSAKLSYERSLRLARSLQNGEETGEALTALAWLSLASRDMPGALTRAREAQQLATDRSDPAAAMQPALVEALVLNGQSQPAAAKATLLALDKSTSIRQAVRWAVESALAQLEVESGKPQADMWFRRAIATFREQRASLNNIDSRLPFFENGSSLYLDYVDQLVREGRTDDALSVLDESRAETLAEGLGVAGSSAKAGGMQAGGHAQALAGRLDGTILVYCLRPGTSYLWAISPRGSGFFRIAGRETILPLVAAHTQAVLSSKDVLAQPDSPGAALYRALVAPAARFLRPQGKVFIVADDHLNTLNFETLPTSGEQPHFWIEDADIVNARSIGLLAARGRRKASEPGERRLLLVGDPVYRHPEEVALPHASEEMARVAEHFTAARRTVLTGAAATPAAYQGSHPEQFAYIHFVAHASASEMNPLDSSVLLSAAPGEAEAYKLYARSILDRRLHADLVTISGCYGSGVRSYSGEGLVGLAWAFLRTGSHHVISALWEVSDASTPQLMGDMYDGLAKGAGPDVALRSAKLAMIHRGGVFRKPFYWAAFQLYSGA